MDWELKVFSAEADRLIALAVKDESLRAELSTLAERILAETKTPNMTEAAKAREEGAERTSAPEPERPRAKALDRGPGPELAPDAKANAIAKVKPEPVSGAKASVNATVNPGPEVRASRDREPLRRLTLGQSVRPPFRPRQASHSGPKPRALGPSAFATAPVLAAIDRDEGLLADVGRHCRMKAEAARWAAEHERWVERGADLESEPAAPGPEITRWADTFLNDRYWRDADSASATDAAVEDVSADDYEQLGGCYEALAETLALVSASPHRALHEALQLAAEAQSALRAAVRRVGARTDSDQTAAFHWIKNHAAKWKLYLERYMKTEDPAAPERWAERIARARRGLERARGAGDEKSGAAHRFREGLDRLRALLGDASSNDARSKDAGPDAQPDEVRERPAIDWPAVVELVDNLVEQGLPPSDRELRSILTPWIDDLPDWDEPPRGLRLVLRAIDQAAEAQAESEAGSDQAAEANESRPSPEVREAARLLADKSVVLIGGSRRRAAEAALQKALGLKELVWVEARAHQSLATFEPFVIRPDVALVLLAIRWSSHSFGDVKAFCERSGKPLVRLPGGYSPNQVAAQVIAQCGKQLAGE